MAWGESVVSMILNQTGQYALRAMAALANLEPGESLRAGELSERTGVPVHYLSKVMRQLVLSGLVSSRKGHGGGFALRRAPRAITMQEVLDAVGVSTSSGVCAFGWGRCNSEDPCSLHEAWSVLSERIESWATTTTLATTRQA